MGTEKPKVSGYVSEEIYARFKSFQEERSPNSASAALGIILSEYFKVGQKVDQQSSLLLTENFVSKERFEDLENKISELPSNLLSELNKIVDEKIGRFQHELLYGSLKLVEVEVTEVSDELLTDSPSSSSKSIEVQTINVESEPQEDSNHLQLDFIDTVVSKEDIEVDSQSSQTDFEQSDFVLSEPSHSLSGQRLAKRLNTQPAFLSKRKNELSKQDFFKWTGKKDPDGISWRPASGDLKSRVKAWIPIENTSSELLGRLKEWVISNSE
jgi:hypothetical protein